MAPRAARRRAPYRPVTAWAVLKDAWRQRHRLGDAGRSRELAAFLPTALEIQQTPPNPPARWLAWSLLALVVVAVLWACFGRVNIVATAEGKIIPSSRVKQIQPLEKGVVKAILVHEGEYVVPGQALIELDTTLSRADIKRLQSERHSSLLQLALKRAAGADRRRRVGRRALNRTRSRATGAGPARGGQPRRNPALPRSALAAVATIPRAIPGPAQQPAQNPR